ncbi:MAG: GNAT family N-acetyltransferase [Oscillospiraceae bacterium]|jgi:GNAT superfamily N-acetyltransferase|nr:GNAT family N-acetyltransferase [Oscillospiraceae bacterium]
MKLEILTPEELKKAYETDLSEAFPPSELKPLSAMESLRERGVYDPLCLRDEAGAVLGYILLWKHLDGRYILIDYLCVPAGRRNGGIGGKLLQTVIDAYPVGTVFLGESEAPSGEPAADEIILRRLAFYRRNGAAFLGYDCALFGVHFKTICWAEPMPPEKEILRKHQEIYLAQFGRERYDRYIQIPLAPGEEPRPLTEWTED